MAGLSALRTFRVYSQPLLRHSSVSDVGRRWHNVVQIGRPASHRRVCAGQSRGRSSEAGQFRKHDQRQSTQDNGRSDDPGGDDPPRTGKVLESLFAIFNIAGLGSVVYVLVFHVGSVGSAIGHSMSPTMNPSAGDRDLVLLNRFVFTKLWYSIQQTDMYRRLFASDPFPFSVGDVVFLVSPFDPNLLTCKRVLALPGDVVSFEGADEERHRMRIPPRHVWVEGDASVDGGDRPIRTSRDSRQYGPVHMDLITSRVDMILWPPKRFGRMPPRPGFDADHMRHLRQLRQARAQVGLRGTAYAGRAHTNDSHLTPYVEWEWTTDEKAKEGMNLLGVEAGKGRPASRRRKLSETNEEERAEIMRRMWNSASRGGRLGDDAGDV